MTDDLKFEERDFGTCSVGITDSVLREYAAQVANAILQAKLDKAPTILMDELYWTWESDEAFRPRAKNKGKLVCIEKIKK